MYICTIQSNAQILDLKERTTQSKDKHNHWISINKQYSQQTEHLQHTFSILKVKHTSIAVSSAATRASAYKTQPNIVTIEQANKLRDSGELKSPHKWNEHID